MSKPSLTIKPCKVWLAPGAKPIDVSAVVEVESSDPLGFYKADEEGEWKFYIVDTIYNHEYV